MLRNATRWATLAVVCALTAGASAADRSAKEILDEIKPLLTQRITTQKQFDQVNAKKIALVEELRKVDPENAELPKLLPARWQALAATGKADEAMKEIDEALPKAKDDEVKKGYLAAKVMVLLRQDDANPDAFASTVEDYLKLAPKDPNGGPFLYMASKAQTDNAKRDALEDRALKDFPQSPYNRMIETGRKMRAMIGKPFNLEFTDAIKGNTVSMKDLRGKVVVVDFWATWCGPCVDEMPKMKKLYAEFKDKGVEFVGVSLDQSKEKGGLDALKKFVEKNEIGWPQYYQGNYWQSEFSASLGINSIPCVFIVDADGNLYSTEARGKLDTLIPMLLKKGRTADGAGGGF